MAFGGYLIRLVNQTYGNYDILPSHIKANTYSVVWNSQDYSAYRDLNGYLHRNAIKSRPPKVEFQVRNGMTSGTGANSLSEFMTAIQKRKCPLETETDSNGNIVVKADERKYLAIIYIPEIDDYVTDYVYMVDPTITMNRIDSNNVIHYNSFRMAFIGYGSQTSYKLYPNITG